MKNNRTPALQRGIEILHLLKKKDSLNLEEISHAIDAPKASVLRLLYTLDDMGIIMKDPLTKRYTAKHVLSRVRASISDAEIQVFLQELAQSSNRRAEFYRTSATGSTIELVATPRQAEVSVSVSVGYLRDWTSELEAVCAVAHAFESSAPQITKAIYPAGKVSKKITSSHARSIINEIKKSGMQIDSTYNSNGVRRLAIALVDPEQTLLGIIALAEVSLQSEKESLTDIGSHLQEQIQKTLLC